MCVNSCLRYIQAFLWLQQVLEVQMVLVHPVEGKNKRWWWC